MESFFCQYERENTVSDLYKEAMVNIMIGNDFKTSNDEVFYQLLLPSELEAQLWIKLKLAAYELRQDRTTSYLEF